MKPNQNLDLSESLDDALIASLLASVGERPVSRLVEHISIGGNDWFVGELDRSLEEQARKELLTNKASEDALRELKSRGKRLHRDEGEGSLQGLVCYFTAIAAAAIQGKIISGEPITRLREALLDLAAVLENEWKDFFQGAASQLLILEE